MNLKSTEGSILAYVLVVLMTFIAWFNMHIKYTYDYIHSKIYIDDIDHKLKQEREMINYVRDSLPICPQNYGSYSFVCTDLIVEVYLNEKFWFKLYVEPL